MLNPILIFFKFGFLMVLLFCCYTQFILSSALKVIQIGTSYCDIIVTHNNGEITTFSRKISESLSHTISSYTSSILLPSQVLVELFTCTILKQDLPDVFMIISFRDVLQLMTFPLMFLPNKIPPPPRCEFDSCICEVRVHFCLFSIFLIKHDFQTTQGLQVNLDLNT